MGIYAIIETGSKQYWVEPNQVIEVELLTAAEGQKEVVALPWREIIDMRHHLVHAYYDINMEILWRTIAKDLPPLIQVLQQVAGPNLGGQDG